VNSTGRVADLRLAGSLAVAANSLVLVGNDLPASAWVLPIVGDVGTTVPMAGRRAGTLCVGGHVRQLGSAAWAYGERHSDSRIDSMALSISGSFDSTTPHTSVSSRLV
jgi:hypothetical protein